MGILSRRQRERQERRSSILDAAESVFFSKGFAAATMDEVAAAAELSKGTLYLYFPSKDELFIGVASRAVATVADDFERIVKGSRDPAPVVLAALIAAYAQFVESHPQHFLLAIGSLVSGVPLDCAGAGFDEHRGHIRRITGAVESLLERGKNEGSLRPELDAVQASAQLWAAMIGTLLIRMNAEEMSRRFPSPVDSQALIEGFIAMILHGFCAPTPETSR